MMKILKVITGIALVIGFLFVSTENNEKDKQIVQKDSQHLLAKMTDPGSGLG
ncbi:hypothetical protein [Bacillus toyonensis]|uniref:hypothetical protein n=1 Tax=Bacillus toyonensis TaxID=155322 RepID=UPI001C0BA0C8|nr:hypothetical protein [Bacillus toyonensis]MBU4643123.1 hypothetical protein [Bacillus toyonensis]